MNCPNCGQLARRDARFCEHCGKPLLQKPPIPIKVTGDLVVGSAIGAGTAIAVGLMITWLGVSTVIHQATQGGSVLGTLGAWYARGSQWQITGLAYYSAHFISLKAAGEAGRVPMPFYVYLVPAIAGIAGGWVAAQASPSIPIRDVAIGMGAAYAVLLWLIRPLFALSVLFTVIMPAGFSTLFFGALLGTGLAWLGAAIQRGSLNA